MADFIKVVSLSETLFKPVKWDICFICQVDGDVETLVFLGYVLERSSYVTTAALLMQWKYVHGIDSSLRHRLSEYETHHDLYEIFGKKNVCFHKTCLLKYSNQKLKRKLVVKQTNIDNLDGAVIAKNAKLTRRLMQAPTFTDTCFFCEGKENLIHCRTMELDRNVRKMALVLEDSKVLAKLAAGDMCATEAVYHKSCFTEFFNKFQRSQKPSSLDEKCNDVEINALSETIHWLKDSIATCLSDGKVPVYTQKDIVNTYKSNLLDYGASKEIIKAVHCTRLTDKILASVPGIISIQNNQSTKRDVVLTLDGELGKAVFQACTHSSTDDIIVIADAAKRIRKVLFCQDKRFDGDTSVECQESSVPPILLRLVSMILEGGKPNRELSEGQRKIACNIAQIIKFNAVKQARNETTVNFRHSRDNEPPLPVVVGLKVHAKTRKKALITDLHEKGFSVSYDRVMDIRSSLAQKITLDYSSKGYVLPPQLQEDLFTSSAIDNFDYNLTSTTASTSIHWTGISIFQHPEDPVNRNPFRFESHCTTKENIHLPSTYTDVQPIRGGKPEPPVQTEFAEKEYVSIFEEAKDWFSALIAADYPKRQSFSSFYSQYVTQVAPKAICVLLPLITEDIKSFAVVAHSMEQVRKITLTLNPDQRPVVTGDQPVYALCKQVQLMSTTLKNFFIKMGDLHTEMAFLSTIGDWIEGSGWTELYEMSAIRTGTEGRVESFLTGKKVKRTRYAYQVTLKVLLQFSRSAFDQSTFENYDVWVKARKVDSTTAFYWFTVIEMITIIFMFVRSIRNPNFRNYVDILHSMMPWFFALDHTNYSRWMTVYINDLLSLPHDSDLHKQFMKGNFTVNKSGRKFSAMGEDQAHEQHNKVIKEDGGCVGLFANDHAILEWAITSPFIMELLDNETPNKDDKKHHEDNDTYERVFIADSKSLHTTWSSYGNPFQEDHPGLVHQISKQILSDEAEKSVRNAYIIGKERYSKFNTCRESLYDTISKNKLLLFRQKNVSGTSKTKQQAVTLKESVNLYKNLFLSCQTRQVNLDQFFSHMNHDFPPTLSEYGKLRHPTSKSDILDCMKLVTVEEVEIYVHPNVESSVVDAPAWVHMHPPRSSKAIGEYCSDEVLGPILNSKLNRTDLVFDVYRKDSLKRDERIRRGNDVSRFSVRKETPIPKNFKSFLGNEGNKTELFRLIADLLLETSGNITLVGTKGEGIVTKHDVDRNALSPCNKEEADTRIFLHVKDQARVYRKIKVVTVDSDVVVIATFVFSSLQRDQQLQELWIEFGSGKNKKWIPIHIYAATLGERRCMALPFFHAFTGSDTTSQFVGKGKKTAWNTWNVLPDTTESFINLSELIEANEKDKEAIERFVCVMYDRGTKFASVNECRRYLFTRMSRAIENCPPTSNVLEQHLKRAQLQASIWINALAKEDPIVDPSQWGWQRNDNFFEPLWSTLPKVADVCTELKRCQCKKRCGVACTCHKNGLACTDRCFCGGQCLST